MNSIISFILLSSASAFAPTNLARSSSATLLYQYAGTQQQFVEVTDLRSPRDIYSMEEWATQYGMQKADGVELYSTNDDMKDYSLFTNIGISAGQTVLFVPSDIVLNSEVIQQEFGNSLQAAEMSLLQIDNQARFPQGAEYRLPLFRLSEYHSLCSIHLLVGSFFFSWSFPSRILYMLYVCDMFMLVTKILIEYEKGTDSNFFPWLNSLPRQFFNGVSMTKVCFRCLPPYAGWLTQNERINCSHFTNGEYVLVRAEFANTLSLQFSTLLSLHMSFLNILDITSIETGICTS